MFLVKLKDKAIESITNGDVRFLRKRLRRLFNELDSMEGQLGRLRNKVICQIRTQP